MWENKRKGRDSFERIFERASESRKTGKRVLKIRDRGEMVKDLKRGESMITKIVPYINRCYSCNIFDIDENNGDIKWEITRLELNIGDLNDGDMFHRRCCRHEGYEKGY